MMISIQKIENISRRGVLMFFVFVLTSFNRTYGQTDKDLPIIEDFEKDSAWFWAPWKNRSNVIDLKTTNAAHSGKFGLNAQGALIVRTDKKIGSPGQVISWWIRFKVGTRADCGFGIGPYEENGIVRDEYGYFLSLDPYTNTFHFAKTTDYTSPPFKVVSQKYKLNVWYRVEVTFNTKTNVTGRLYSANGSTLLNSITVEIPNLSPGGIAFKGTGLYLDDIRGGTKGMLVDADTGFVPKLGEHLILKNIVFEVNKSNLLDQSFVELDKLVAYLKRNPAFKIQIVGHTDNIGKEDENKNLSEARATVVADYLIKHGINKNHISSSGLGSSNPIATNATEEGRKKNRRVECIIN